MTEQPKKPQRASTLDKIFRVEQRLEVRKGDLAGLLENQLCDLILLHDLRNRLREEMVTDAFGMQGMPGSRTNEGMEPRGEESSPAYDQVEYDHLLLVDKKRGDYDSMEYILEGQLGVYRIRVGHSITDEGTTLDVYQNDKRFVTLYCTNTRGVYTGEDDEGEFYIFRIRKGGIDVFKRKYD